MQLLSVPCNTTHDPINHWFYSVSTLLPTNLFTKNLLAITAIEEEKEKKEEEKIPNSKSKKSDI